MIAETTADISADVSAGISAGISDGQLASDGPLGLYVHFPFCSVHCPYCDFAVETRAEIPHDAYAAAVISELGVRARWFEWSGEGGRAAGGGGPGGSGPGGGSVEAAAGPALASIYFGGGTPGLWRPQALGRVIDEAKARLGRGAAGRAAAAAPIEITIEANPGEVDEATLRAFRAVGVNRLSLGLQSPEDRLLRVLGRNHDAAAGPAAVRAARAAGIDNLSLDLMFALPGQSFDDWRRAVDLALALGPDHVSAYALTIERGTPFGTRVRKGELQVPDDEQAAAMQEWVRDALGAAGLPQYEVSSYARAGRRSVHNALYWAGAPYLGVGASAASFRPLADGTGWRFSNPRATAAYLREIEAGRGSPAPAVVEKRTAADLENEAVWLALRTTDGLDRATHARRHGADPVTPRETEVRRCVERGWLQVDAVRVRPTSTGLLFADEVAARLWL